MTENDTAARIYDLVPKNKFDSSHIEDLKRLTDKEIAPILPALLEWIQDMNWPVAHKVLPVLALHQSSLIPHILKALAPEEKDDMWKYWIITCLLPLFSERNIALLTPALKRIAEQPTQNERLGEVNDEAVLFLKERT